MAKKIFDVSVTVRNGMVHWPGDPEVEIKRLSSIDKGDEANVSAINFGLHTGTHMDAPLHFIDGAEDITAFPEELMEGRCQVINIDNPEYIGKEELENKKIVYDRILFRTRNSDSEWFKQDFKEDYIYLNDEGAAYLVSKKVKLAGIDYLSIAEFKAGQKTHQSLLGSGCWVIEGLYLKDISEGEYEILALPLKIAGADGAPVRVVLIPV